MELQALVNYANAQYSAKGLAIVHEVPTKWIPIRGRRGEITSAKVEEKAAVDYIGISQGRGIAFDAKHSYEKRISWDRVEPHQADFLDRWEAQGGIAGILVGFSMKEFFWVPWLDWKVGANKAANGAGKKSFNIEEARGCYREVKQTPRVVLDYLAVLKHELNVDNVVDNVDK